LQQKGLSSHITGCLPQSCPQCTQSAIFISNEQVKIGKINPLKRNISVSTGKMFSFFQ